MCGANLPVGYDGGIPALRGKRVPLLSMTVTGASPRVRGNRLRLPVVFDMVLDGMVVRLPHRRAHCQVLKAL